MSGSIIGRTTRIRGNIAGPGPIEVLGQVEGDVVSSDDVTLGEQAQVQGNITGTTLRIAGAVAGNLEGSEAVLLEAGARVIGDLTAPRIGIAEGALVRGRVRTDGAEAPHESRLARAARPVRRETTDVRPVRPDELRPARREPVVAAPRTEEPPAVVESKAKAPPARRRTRSAGAITAAQKTEAAPAPAEAAPAKKVARKPPPAPVVPAVAKGTRGRRKKVRRK